MRLRRLGIAFMLLTLALPARGWSAGAPRRAPELVGGGKWFNTPAGEALTLASLRGRVVLVEFWTAGCINCLNTLPAVKGWHARHSRRGFVVVGVHSPEFKHEHDEAYVRKSIAKLGIRYPVVMDNQFKIWKAYNNIYWPTMYLIDKTGRIRHQQIGEGYYDQTEELIRTLLAESP